MTKFKIGDKLRVIKRLEGYEELGVGWTTVVTNTLSSTNGFHVEHPVDKTKIYCRGHEADSFVKDTIAVGDHVRVTEYIVGWKHFGSGYIATLEKYVDNGFLLKYQDTPMYCTWSEWTKIEKIDKVPFEDGGNVVLKDSDIDDNFVLNTSFDTNNGDNDSLVVKAYADGSTLITIEMLEDTAKINAMCKEDVVIESVELDLPLEAVKKLKCALDAIIDMEGVYK